MNSQDCFYRLTDEEKNITEDLFCFAPAGASAFSSYYGWRKILQPQVRLFVAELPGRGCRITDPQYTHFQDLIEELYEAFKRVLTNNNYMFLGHSFGGLISYELTKKIQLLAELQGPKHIFIAGSNPPHVPSTIANLITLDDDNLVNALKELGGVEAHVADSEAFHEICLPIIRSDFMLSSNYPRNNLVKFSCPISILNGHQDKLILKQHIGEWDRYSNDPIQYYTFQGDHFFIQQYKDRIADIIKKATSNIPFYDLSH